MPTPHSYFKSELILKTVMKIMKLDDILILHIATNVDLNTNSPV